ncbi:hypothetical protein VK86_13615 [Moellerella wisconsensis]|nr:hypothetical protein VK86_13615 [Moellerella wisconsensis]
MVGWTKASKDAPGSLLTGYANLVQLTTLLRLASLGGDKKNINLEVVIMDLKTYRPYCTFPCLTFPCLFFCLFVLLTAIFTTVHSRLHATARLSGVMYV